jgi:site-specific DNA-methyltransferase (adenine-specific)
LTIAAVLSGEERWTVAEGDCLAVLRDMPDESVDAVVTDPPYGLGRDPTPEQLARWVQGESENLTAHDFMGKDWQVPSIAVWRECLRVLKPGGAILAFAGDRTVELIAIGIRLAGFQRRGMIAWHFGSGFPKSAPLRQAFDQMEWCDCDGEDG